ncbi:hypothetical protein PM082_023458 [Marasmius tenuissimus]|nr:hypothetical protein PM082_023458 [Marasmius tenuissimus]
MDLILADPDPWNTTFALPDGQPIYHVETNIGFLSRDSTFVKKISGRNAADMSIIDSQSSWGENLVRVWGKNVAPHREGFISTSEVFTASDGKSYKWKNDWDIMTLTSPDGSYVASFDPGSSGLFSKYSPAVLRVHPQAVHIVDEIVATWIYMQQKKRTRRRRRNRRAVMF